ncbi:MAG: hypothetical protein KDK91_18670 [Gammaproteobacteria bacterium]|nr:hypothetical protein [Gammaproteobacteria bacterium]
MKSMGRGLVCLMLCVVMLANSACTSLRSVDVLALPDLADPIRPGDELTVTFKDQRRERITVTALDEFSLSGIDDRGQPLVTPLGQIQTIEMEKLDVGKTLTNVGLGIGTAVLGALVLLMLGMEVLSK